MLHGSKCALLYVHMFVSWFGVTGQTMSTQCHQVSMPATVSGLGLMHQAQLMCSTRVQMKCSHKAVHHVM